MIKTASSNVSPAEVELELMSLPDVHMAYVVGLSGQGAGVGRGCGRHPARGSYALDFAAIEAELRSRLSSFKVPLLSMWRWPIPMCPCCAATRSPCRMIEKLLAERLGREV